MNTGPTGPDVFLTTAQRDLIQIAVLRQILERGGVRHCYVAGIVHGAIEGMVAINEVMNPLLAPVYHGVRGGGFTHMRVTLPPTPKDRQAVDDLVAAAEVNSQIMTAILEEMPKIQGNDPAILTGKWAGGVPFPIFALNSVPIDEIWLYHPSTKQLVRLVDLSSPEATPST